MVKLKLVDQEDEEEMEAMMRFAETFGHRLMKCPWPLYAVLKDNVMRGYFHNVVHAIIHPAISDLNTPRETYELIREVVTRVAATGHTVAVMVPTDPETKFTPEILEKLGLFPTDHLLYTNQPKT